VLAVRAGEFSKTGAARVERAICPQVAAPHRARDRRGRARVAAPAPGLTSRRRTGREA